METQIAALETSIERLKGSARIMTRKLYKIIQENEKAVQFIKSTEFSPNAKMVQILSDLQLSTRQRISQINVDNDLFYARQINRILIKLQNDKVNNNSSVETCSSSKCNSVKNGTSDGDVETSPTVNELSKTLTKIKIFSKEDSTKRLQYSTSEEEIPANLPRNNRRHFAQNSKRPFNFIIEKEIKETTTGMPLSFNIVKKPVTLGNDVPDEPKLNDLCTVSYYEGPGIFYINMVNDKLDILERLTDSLNAYGNSTTPFRSKTEANLILGKKCVVYSENYENWYRADIIDWLPDSQNEICVQFMDYGDIENIVYTKVRIIRPADLTYDNFALKCYLTKSVSTVANNWSEADVDAFCNYMENVERNLYRIKFRCKIQDYLAIDLVNIQFDETEGTQTVANSVINSRKLPKKVVVDTDIPVAKLRRPRDLRQKVLESILMPAIGQVITMYVTGFETANAFYGHTIPSDITTDKGVTDLKKLVDSINTSGKTYIKYEYPPTVGTVVLAKWQNHLLRAMIEYVFRRGNGSYAIHVSFFDYGQVETLALSDIWEIPDEYLVLPKQALKCIIWNIVPFNKSNVFWIREKLDNLYLASTFTVEIVESKSDYIIGKVFFQGSDLGGKLVVDGLAQFKESDED